MHSCLLRNAGTFVLLCCLAALTAAADEPPKPADTSQEQAPTASKLQGWQIFGGVSSVWPRLEESEAKIDKQMNKGLGRLFPRWDEPTTFADWRDECKLGDVQVGIGHELTDRLDWWAVFGGAKGRITNDEKYFPLGLPLKLNIDFSRKEWYASTGLDYYPWGRPELPENETEGKGIVSRVRAAKPFIEGCTTWLNIREIGEVGADLPVIGNVMHYQDKCRYSIIGLSPRVGIEYPLTEHNSLATTAGYNFFTSHSDEFNGFILCTVLRHRF